DTVRLEGTLKDLAGNEASSAAKPFTLSSNPGITIDTKAPQISVDKPIISDYAKAHNITLNITDRDPEPEVYHLWSLDMNPPPGNAITGVGAAGGELLPPPGSVDGNYYVHIRAVDDVGNEAVETFGPYGFD